MVHLVHGTLEKKLSARVEKMCGYVLKLVAYN